MLPAKVSIFRGPMTRLAAGDAERLRREVRHVVLGRAGAFLRDLVRRDSVELDRY